MPKRYTGPDPEILKDLYLNRRLTFFQIGEMFGGKSISTVSTWMRRAGIAGRSSKERMNNMSDGVKEKRARKISSTMKGYEKSEEHKRSLSDSIKKKYREDDEYRKKQEKTFEKMHNATRGKKPWNYGLTKNDHSSIEEGSRKLSILYKDKSKTPNWKGGVSYEPYPIEFSFELKHAIKLRDNYRCRNCSQRKLNKDLHVHHIDYCKENNDKSNLITLCDECHGQTCIVDIEKEKYWIEYYQTLAKKLDFESIELVFRSHRYSQKQSVEYDKIHN